MGKLQIFADRLDKIGVKVKLVANYPWIYIDEINSKRVTENYKANHGFCVAYTPISNSQELQFTDITEIFKLIRKYCR